MGLSPEQLAFRRTGIGGSEISAVVGVNPWMKPIDVWLSKTGRSEVVANDKMEWGSRLEASVLQKYSDVHGVEVVHSAEYFPESVHGTVRHKAMPFVIATPDGLTRAPKRVQVKCSSGFGATAWGEHGDPNGVPEYVICQSMWEGIATGVHAADVVVLIDGHDYREYPVTWDGDLAGLLLDEAGRFWRDHIEGGTQPTGGSETFSRYLMGRYPQSSGKLLPPPAGLYEIAREFDLARAEEKVAKERKDSLGEQLRALIGEHDGFEGPGLKATWKWQAGKPEYKAIAEELGTISDELRKKHTGRVRVLNVKVEG